MVGVGGYSWLTNAVPAEEVIPARLVILTAMAAMLVASLAVPGAFGEYGVLFGVALAGFLDGFVQGALWTIALAIDYGVAFSSAACRASGSTRGTSWSATAS